eukprot:symbB.v1.2.005155.t4/scaffold297.1/size245286/8
MISRMMGTLKGTRSSAATATPEAPPVPPVTGPVVTAVLLEDADESFADGRMLHVGEDGMLDMGEQDHVCGLDSTIIKALPCYTLEEAPKDAQPCTICQETFAKRDVLKELPCQHRFHQGCIEKWLEMSEHCPVRNGPLPTGNWEDSQEKLRKEWYEKLAAGVEDNDRGRRSKASLRGAAGSLRRPGASLRTTASASGSAANSQMGSLAPSRASQSPVMSPRQSGDTEGDAPPMPPPPPPRKGKSGGLGPGPPLPGGGPGPPAGSKLQPNWAF